MHQNMSHLCHNLEIRHNWLELLDYYHQICQLFDNYEVEILSNIKEQDNFSSINSIIAHINKFEEHIVREHFPLIQASLSLIDTQTPLEHTQERNRRALEIKNYLNLYCPAFSALNTLPPKKIKMHSNKQQLQTEKSWETLSFDIDLMLANCEIFERANINKEVHDKLKQICTKDLWTPHRATQKMAHTFDRLHFIISRLQRLIRLKVSFERQYSPALAALIQLSSITHDFENKIIKQKLAEEKRLSEIHHFSSPRQK